MAPDSLRYGLLFDGDPLHRGLLAVTDKHGARSIVFTPERRERSLAPDGGGAWATLDDYIVEGVWHTPRWISIAWPFSRRAHWRLRPLAPYGFSSGWGGLRRRATRCA